MKHGRILAVVMCAGAWAMAAGGAIAGPQQSAEAEHRAAGPVATEPGSAAFGASVPRLVQFNGTLKDAAARPVSGAASVTFAIYAEQDGGVALWSETQNVIADSNGHYNALLGGATANGMPAELFGTGQSRWLGVTIARQPEMARVLLASVPYALKAQDAETLGGLPASDYVTTKSLAAANGHAGPAIVTGGGSTIVAMPQVATNGAQVSQQAIPQVTPSGMGTINFLPIWTSTTALGNSTIFESAGLVGIGTTSPAEALDVNGNSIFRGSFQLPPGHEATATTGYESHSFQFQASSFNSSTKKASDHAFGFRAEPLNNNTTNPTAKLDLFFGLANGTLTDTGLSFSNAGIITFAPGQNFAGANENLTGALNLAATGTTAAGVITLGGNPYIGAYGNQFNNNFIGQQAGIAAVQPSSNDNGFGAGALELMTGAVNDVAIGGGALNVATTGSFNVATGTVALGSLTVGKQNTAVGDFAGFTVTTGTLNTLIGAESDVSSPSLTNATAIGANAKVGASNSLVLGGTGANIVNVGIGTPTPRSAFEISSAVLTDPGTGTGKPSPILSMTNTAGGFGATVAMDFNTSDPGAATNPGYRIMLEDDGHFSDDLYFFANNSSAGRSGAGFVNTLFIDAQGNMEIPGNLKVDGMIAKPGGSFKIDDPIDPGGKYLSHSFVESPDMMNIYNGNVTTDENGYATVEMPAWFEALNGDFRYQLTTMGQFAQAMVAEKMKERKFTIRTDKPRVEVSWQVTGIRHDAWANAHRIPTEEAKPQKEHGKYMNPELFGATPDKTVGRKASVPSAAVAVGQK